MRCSRRPRDGFHLYFSCYGIPPELALFQDRAEEGNDDNASVFTS